MHKRNDNFNPKDEMRTPPSLFKKLDDRFQFTVDIAANVDNKLTHYFFDDFLSEGHHLTMSDIAYCNPPYSRGKVELFVKKSYEESLKGAIVVMLLPVDFSARWWDYCMKATEWIRITSRVHFNGIDNKPIKGSPFFSSVVVVFDEQAKQSLLADEMALPLISEMDWR